MHTTQIFAEHQNLALPKQEQSKDALPVITAR